VTYRVPPRLGYVVPDAPEGGPLVAFVMPLPDGPAVVLRNSAALIWALAADGEADVPAAVAEMVGRSLEEVGPATRDYLVDLVAQGLLEEEG